MKSFLKLAVFLLPIFLLSSCNNSQSNFFTDWTNQEDNTEGYQYSLEDFGMSIAWTAYKFTDKVSVSGTFQDYTLNEKNSSGSIEYILSGLQLAISTESIVTTNAIQDFKIKSYFFKVFNTSTITGTVINASEGVGDILLVMNNMSYKTPYSYSLKDDIIVLSTHLDLKNWEGEEAIAELNQQWSGNHKGTDPILNLWPEIDVTIQIPVNKILKKSQGVMVYRAKDVSGKIPIGLNE